MNEAELKISRALQTIGKRLDNELKEIAGERCGFVLLTLPLGRDGIVNYMSNCERPDIIRAWAQLLEHWLADYPDLAAHLKQ